LIFGLNPRRPYDEPYKQFVEGIGRVSTGLVAQSIDADKARKCEERLAQELTAGERFLANIAEVVTVGIHCLDLEGLLT
jgi:hypothetical protein